jgi:hypothetical protein
MNVRRCALVVEDEPFIALDLEDALVEMGFYVCGLAATQDRENLNFDQVLAITTYEVIADRAYLQPLARMLFELNCSERLFRQLSMSLNPPGEQSVSSETTGEWKHVPPEGNNADLLKLVCPQQ